jgi:hypothetical protein
VATASSAVRLVGRPSTAIAWWHAAATAGQERVVAACEMACSSTRHSRAFQPSVVHGMGAGGGGGVASAVAVIVRCVLLSYVTLQLAMLSWAAQSAYACATLSPWLGAADWGIWWRQSSALVLITSPSQESPFTLLDRGIIPCEYMYTSCSCIHLFIYDVTRCFGPFERGVHPI